jgi:hypothetical protein
LLLATTVSSFSFITATYAAVTPTHAVTAHAFLDTMGVNTHFGANNGVDAYSNVAMIEGELTYTGLRWQLTRISADSVSWYLITRYSSS